VQEDQIGYAGGSNLYAYVGGDVLEAKDSDGLIKDATWATAGWDVMCLSLDACPDATGALRLPSGGGTWGERQAAELIGWGQASYAEWQLWDTYKRYRQNYEQLKSSVGGSGTRPEVRAMFTHSKALGRRHFEQVIEAVTRGTSWSLGGFDLFGLEVVGSFLNRLIGGAIFLNSRFVERYQSSEHDPAMTVFGVTLIHGDRFFASTRRPYLANMMVHEELHNLFPGTTDVPGGHCAIYAMANLLTGTSVPCR